MKIVKKRVKGGLCGECYYCGTGRCPKDDQNKLSCVTDTLGKEMVRFYIFVEKKEVKK